MSAALTVEYGTKLTDGTVRWADSDGELRIGSDYYTATDLPALRTAIARHRANGGKTELVQRSITYGTPVPVPAEVPTKPGVYLPYFYPDGTATPNVWLLKRDGTWIQLPNCAGVSTSVLEPQRVLEALSSLVFLGTGTDAQKVAK